jgi:hypothetical protein
MTGKPYLIRLVRVADHPCGIEGPLPSSSVVQGDEPGRFSLRHQRTEPISTS